MDILVIFIFSPLDGLDENRYHLIFVKNRRKKDPSASTKRSVNKLRDTPCRMKRIEGNE